MSENLPSESAMVRGGWVLQRTGPRYIDAMTLSHTEVLRITTVFYRKGGLIMRTLFSNMTQNQQTVVAPRRKDPDSDRLASVKSVCATSLHTRPLLNRGLGLLIALRCLSIVSVHPQLSTKRSLLTRSEILWDTRSLFSLHTSQ